MKEGRGGPAAAPLDHARALLEEMRTGPLELAGGYGAVVFGDLRDCTVIVWASPEGEPFVEIISDADLTRWYERAEGYHAENLTGDWVTAMHETEGDEA